MARRCRLGEILRRRSHHRRCQRPWTRREASACARNAKGPVKQWLAALDAERYLSEHGIGDDSEQFNDDLMAELMADFQNGSADWIHPR